MTSLAPYDAVLLLSFGGPDGPDDVLPFLRNVTAGRGIPDERLAEVAGHYHHLGGRSPINDQNRALVAALRDALAARGHDLPVLWGNRNWAPYLKDVLREAHACGIRRPVTVLTSAYSSYSSCRQYREDLGEALLTLATEGVELAVDKVRPYFNHPGFVEQNAAAALGALTEVPDGSHLVFVTHSVPEAMDQTSGPVGHAYSAQHRDLATVVAGAVGDELGRVVPWELVYCSRSGSPSQPWLEPDVGDHLRRLRSAGVPGVAVCPIGFVSDHMEVAYDLDTEAREVADQIGLPFARAATVGTSATFVNGLVDLIEERAAEERGTGERALGERVLGERATEALGEQPQQPALGEQPQRPALGVRGSAASVCPPGCCRNLRAERPAACGADWVQPVGAIA